jgi:hypothetical protein
MTLEKKLESKAPGEGILADFASTFQTESATQIQLEFDAVSNNGSTDLNPKMSATLDHRT